jgi:hypothetical protein
MSMWRWDFCGVEAPGERGQLLCGWRTIFGAALEVGADGRDRGFLLLGLIDAEAGKDVQGVLPVGARLFGLVECVVGVGEPVVGAGLVVGLVQFDGEREGLVVVGERGIRIAGGVVESAQALPRFELRVAAAAFASQVEQPPVAVGGLLVSALYPVDHAEAGQRGLLVVAVAGSAGKF